MHEKPSRESMRRILASCGIELSAERLALFWRFYELLARHTRALDLSRLTRFDDIVVKHFADSALVPALCTLPRPLLDIGTGAGFPGIPLKIMLPDLELVLAEPRHARVEFLELAVKELSFEGVQIYPHLVSAHSPLEARGVITRALEGADETLARVNHILPAGGRVILMKGPSADEDLGELGPQSAAHFALVDDREYTIPSTTYRRRLLVFEKTSSYRKLTYRIFTRQENTATVITSADNRRFKELKKMAGGGPVKKTGAVLVSGKKLVLETATRFPERAETLVTYDGYAETDAGMNALVAAFAGNDALVILKKALFNELDSFDTNAPLLALRVTEPPEWDGALFDGCTLLVPFQDPANVGAVIRSAAAFGAGGIVMLREAAHPFHPRSIRASGGAVLAAPLYRGPSLGELPALCARHRDSFYALDMRGEPIGAAAFPERFILLPGVEGPGIPRDLPARRVAIPMSGAVESLNAAVAASIALYAWKAAHTRRF
ncbi:MAG: 16S rRNA (guanine(527)-N(7))-methyltransferase RsmG [Spirochaetes bacterium]|nr:MAG: 16S rRNA (guanine(527)-N(7))-methyltransferase RsmG [Spirochaetota bacterium]